MTKRTEEEKILIEKMRAKMDMIEEATRESDWVTPTHKKKILSGLSLMRANINEGQTDPSIKMMYTKMIDARAAGMTDLTLDDLIRLFKDSEPTNMFHLRQGPLLIISRVGNWHRYEGIKPDPPTNYKLPATHPDRTDRYGYPIFLIGDEQGLEIKGQDHKALSMMPDAIKARTRYGAIQRYKGEIIGTGGSLEPEQIEKRRAKISPTMKKAYETELAKINLDPKKVNDRLFKWANDWLIPHKLANLKKTLETTGGSSRLNETKEYLKKEYDGSNINIIGKIKSELHKAQNKGYVFDDLKGI